MNTEYEARESAVINKIAHLSKKLQRMQEHETGGNRRYHRKLGTVWTGEY